MYIVLFHPSHTLINALQFNRVTPGNASPWIGAPPPPTGFLDPSHPFAKRGSGLMRVAPNIDTRAFTLKAIPRACLYKPDPATTAATPHGPAPARWPADRRLNMSVVNFVSKARVHKSAAIRKKISLRVQCAFALVATRGADCGKDTKGNGIVVFNRSEECAKWIVQGVSCA